MQTFDNFKFQEIENADFYWHAQELAATEERILSGQSKFMDWEEAKTEILRQIDDPCNSAWSNKLP